MGEEVSEFPDNKLTTTEGPKKHCCWLVSGEKDHCNVESIKAKCPNIHLDQLNSVDSETYHSLLPQPNIESC